MAKPLWTVAPGTGLIPFKSTRAMAWNHNFKPASGTPASGTPVGGNGSHGSSAHPGYRPPRAFTTADATGDAKLDNLDPAEQEYRQRRRQEKRAQREIDEARAQELRDSLYTLALNASSERTRVSATDSWLNRHEGMPVARNINLSVNDMSALSDTDLDAEIARLAGTEGGSGAAASGEAAPDVPE